MPSPGSVQPLFDRLYEELKRIAHRHLDGRDGTLQTTGLVHEAWLKLNRGEATVEDPAHLLNLASRAMRQIVVDAARRRHAEKRGAGALRVTLDERIDAPGHGNEVDVLAIEQSLQRLEGIDARLAKVVEMHFFGGLGFAEISQALGVTERTLFRDWRTARAMILADLGGAA